MKSKKEKNAISKKKAVAKKSPEKPKKLTAKKAVAKKTGKKNRLLDVKDYVSDRVFEGTRRLSKKREEHLKSKRETKKPSKKTDTTSKKENMKLSKISKPKKEKEAKKFFPKGAKPPSTPAGAVEPKVSSKRTPWMKKPIENPHSTPAGPCVNLKDLFDNYLDKRYKKIKEEQRRTLWQTVSLQMLTEPFNRLNEIIDSHLSKK